MKNTHGYWRRAALTDVLLSIKPKYVREILDGTKQYEFRKQIFRDRSRETVFIYSSSPEKKIVVQIPHRRDCGKPPRLSVGGVLGCLRIGWTGVLRVLLRERRMDSRFGSMIWRSSLNPWIRTRYSIGLCRLSRFVTWMDMKTIRGYSDMQIPLVRSNGYVFQFRITIDETKSEIDSPGNNYFIIPKVVPSCNTLPISPTMQQNRSSSLYL